MIELLTAGMALLTVMTYGVSPASILVFLFCCALIVITFIDYDYFIIPDVISKPGIAVGVALGAINHLSPEPVFGHPVVGDLWECFWGVMLGGGFLWAVSYGYLKLRKKDGLGFGDVKLLAMTGAIFGPASALYTIFLGSLVGSIAGIGLVLFMGRKMSQPLPFGPYLAFGTILFLFVDAAQATAAIDILGGLF
jgi:leader peptidase (prepilin peptidase)/N-methyltransferase